MKPAASAHFDSFELARNQLRMEGRATLAQLTRLATLADLAGELDYSIEGWTDVQGRPGARMSLKADLLLVCQRCGDSMAWPLERTVDFLFVKSEAELDLVPLDDDALEAIVASRATDVLAWIEDEALLSLPLVARHSTCRVQPEDSGGVIGGSESIGSEATGSESAGSESTGSVPTRTGAFAALAALRPRPAKPGRA